MVTHVTTLKFKSAKIKNKRARSLPFLVMMGNLWHCHFSRILLMLFVIDQFERIINYNVPSLEKPKMPPITLGIESSCDETGLALYQMGRGLLAHALYTQVAMHNEYGGVVPELASRDHVRRVIPLLRQIMREAGVSLAQINVIAYTQGPGLGGALLVGASIANALAYALDIPTIGIHHLEGHLLSPLLSDPAPEFPFVALLVSGGHTQLMRVDGVGQYTLLGETVDDAAGPLTRAQSCWGWVIRAAPPWRNLPRRGDPAYTSYHVRCCIAAIWISVSAV